MASRDTFKVRKDGKQMPQTKQEKARILSAPFPAAGVMASSGLTTPVQTPYQVILVFSSYNGVSEGKSYHAFTNLFSIRLTNADPDFHKLFSLFTSVAFRRTAHRLIATAMQRKKLTLPEGRKVQELMIVPRIMSLQGDYKKVSQKLGGVGLPLRTLLDKDVWQMVKLEHSDHDSKRLQTLYVQAIVTLPYYPLPAETLVPHGVYVAPDLFGKVVAVSWTNQNKQGKAIPVRSTLITSDTPALTVVDLLCPLEFFLQDRPTIKGLAPAFYIDGKPLGQVRDSGVMYSFAEGYDLSGYSMPKKAFITQADGTQDLITTMRRNSAEVENQYMAMRETIAIFLPDLDTTYSSVVAGHVPAGSIAMLGQCTAMESETVNEYFGTRSMPEDAPGQAIMQSSTVTDSQEEPANLQGPIQKELDQLNAVLAKTQQMNAELQEQMQQMQSQGSTDHLDNALMQDASLMDGASLSNEFAHLNAGGTPQTQVTTETRNTA